MATKKSAIKAASKNNVKKSTSKKLPASVSVQVQAAEIEANLDRREKRIDRKLRELKELRAVSAANTVVNRQMTGFVDFLREQSVVGLAIGLVLGTQLKQFVDSVVLNFINPFIGLALPGRGTLEEKVFTLHMFDKTGTFGWGAVAATLVSFVAVAALVYATFKLLKLDRLAKKKEDTPDKQNKSAKTAKKDKAK